MEKPTKEEYLAWANHNVTAWVREKLVEQRSEFSSLDNTLADFAAMDSPEFDAAQLGLNAACRMSVVRGIDLFTDFESFFRENYPEEAEHGI